MPLIAQLPPCLIGMEACSGAHHWARVFAEHGHTVKLMAPKLVSPYRMSGKRGKNDAADAAAICEAVTRPSMRFVPVKDEHQQATLCLHRTRQGFIEERTSTYNRLRGLLSEFGVVMPQSPERLRKEIGPFLDSLPGWARRCMSELLEHTSHIEDRLVELDRAINQIAREDDRSRRLLQLRGVGSTTASALVATIGDGHDFRNGRGLVLNGEALVVRFFPNSAGSPIGRLRSARPPAALLTDEHHQKWNSMLLSDHS
ncbi:ISPsy16 transposase [Pseudomonas syringae pv. tagetis]|nr:hypothetical protein ALP93_200251 [Pseudomonas syringae pv. helianthi]RMW13915.1 ISPsy16 transposase [Pseudomonas syringae pv. tagetis]RMW26619.1 ISPsy16 transposase [Pseudomonas syringae pv. tagetis]